MAQLNDGARQLRKLGMTQAQIARELDVSRTIVGRWWAGTAVPGAEYRVEIEARGWVKGPQWDQVGGKGAQAVASPTAAPTPEPTDTRSRLVAQADRLRALLDGELTTSGRIQTERALGAALASIAKLDGTQITESTIVRHPAHERLMARVYDITTRYPLVHRQVTDALRIARGEDQRAIEREYLAWCDSLASTVEPFEAANMAFAAVMRPER